MPISAPPRWAISFSKMLRSVLNCIELFGSGHADLGALDGFLVSELGCFVGLSGVIAGGHGMLYTGSVRAFVALLGCGPVTLGRPFMMVRGGDVGIFWQGERPFSGKDGLRDGRIGSFDLVQTIREWAEALRHLHGTLTFVYVKRRGNPSSSMEVFQCRSFTVAARCGVRVRQGAGQSAVTRRVGER